MLKNRFKVMSNYVRHASRSYSGFLGKKFSNISEVVQVLSQMSWKSEDFIPSCSELKDLPSETEIKKLLKLSGLPENNWKSAQHVLAKQLPFINYLRNVEVNENTDSANARLAPRRQAPLTYEQLKSNIEGQVKDAKLGEPSGIWNSTGLSNLIEDGFFVVREEVKNRNKENKNYK